MARGADERRAARAASLAKQALTGNLRPVRVAVFYARALLTAARTGDGYAFAVSTWPRDLAGLLELAGDAREVVEIGTATGWTTIALALQVPGRRVHSYDPVARPERERYLRLVPAEVRERVTFHPEPGETGADPAAPVDFLFIDSSHEYEETVGTYRNWASRLAPGATVAFHDYGAPEFPDVERAVRDLGLRGEARGRVFVVRV